MYLAKQPSAESSDRLQVRGGMMTTKYPEIEVELIGRDGNAFSIIAAVTRSLRRNKVSEEEISSYKTEAMNGDYNHLLATTMNWVTVL